jgi:hypothetical protein
VGTDTLVSQRGGLIGVALLAAISLVVAQTVGGQSIQLPWSGFAHTPQHDCVSMVPSQPLNRILWTMPVGEGGYDTTHFSAPVITRSNTVIFPMNLAKEGYNFRIEALLSSTGQTNWEQFTDYTALTGTVPICPLALTPRNRLYFGGAGGTVFYCDSPDAATPPSFTRTSFYGLSEYLTNTNVFNSKIFICTPITPDRYGDIFFAFQTTGASPLGNKGGLARIDYNGNGSWINASNTIGSTNVSQPIENCAPALSLDQKTIYCAVLLTNPLRVALAALDSRTLAPISSMVLIDPQSHLNIYPNEDSTSSPTIGPDGDVYFGVLANPGSGDGSGWLLHFDSSLSVAKTPGGFGWDVTDAVVSASLVPSYQGNSRYLLATKYNNYAAGQYRMAILDPEQGTLDPQSKVVVMAQVLTFPSPSGLEWCVNSAAVDPFNKSILINNENGWLYRWDLTSNQLTQQIALTSNRTGEAYTPTVIGVDGTVYAINHGVLFAVGQ